VSDLLKEFPDVLQSDGFTAAPPRHKVRHHILTKPGPPVFAKARRLDPAKLAVAKAEFSAMEKAGIIRRSVSPWASPLHMVKKKGGGWRPCGDYRRLNTATVPDRYPLPNIADFTSRISGSTVFSKLDLQKGYYQVPVEEGDIQKTAIITPFGMFEFLVMPFGLRNAGNTFQRLMDQILGDLPYCFVYVDDILVFSKDLTSHVQHLREVFLLCREYGLTIGLPKCEFAVQEIEFLGHRLSASGCTPLTKHTEAISSFPQPTDKPGLQRFLGMVNFYRKFLRGAARVLAPLTDALKGPGKTKTILWTPLMDSAFVKIKNLLSSVPELVHPQCNAPISLAVDASDSHIGAVLQQQLRDKSWSPLAFFSKKLSDTERRYSAFDRELLAAYISVRHFRFMLEGREFTIFTDHKPLTHALFRTSPPWSARQQRQLAYLAEFTSTIVHVPGKENVVPDALSRPDPARKSPDVCIPSSAPDLTTAPVCSVPGKPALFPTTGGFPKVIPVHPSCSVPGKPALFPTTGRFPKVIPVHPSCSVPGKPALFPTTGRFPNVNMFRSQAVKDSSSALVSAPGGDPLVDPFLQELEVSSLSKLQASCASVQEMKSSSSLSVIIHPLKTGNIFCDISTGSLRPLVPVPLRRLLFNQIHNVSHPGIRGSRRLISARFVWPGMSKDVGLWARACIPCQKSKISTHVHSPVQPIPVPTRRFSHVHIDIVGPLPSCQGYSYLLTMIDRTTRWPEVAPLSSISAESCVRAFISTWISRFGVPAVITSDRGSQFTSSVWSGVCAALGIATSNTTSFHPQSNGIIERFHRSLKSSLRARLAGSDWLSHLPLVLLGLRATPKEDTGFSVSEAVFGSALTLPGEMLDVPELHSDSYLRKIERAVNGFAVNPPHHVRSTTPPRVPAALMKSKFVFVREDTVKPTLAPRYRGPYLVVSRQSKYFRLQIGAKQDSVSVDRLKPVFSDSPLVPAVPPPRGRPPRPHAMNPPDPPVPPDPPNPPPSTSVKTRVCRRVRFQTVPQLIPPPVPVRRNPYRSSRDRRISSAIAPPFLLGGLLWRL